MRGRAVVFEDRGKVVFRGVELPEPAAGDVVIEAAHSWISSGTESSFLRGERSGGEIPYKPGDPWPFPAVRGYQNVGVVRSVGNNVQGLEAGDVVFSTSGKVEGLAAPRGGHVSPVITSADQVWKLPPGANPLDYAGMVLTQVGYNCGMRAPVGRGAGTKAVVIGDGLVAQWTAQTLLHRGAATLVLGRHDAKLDYLPPGIAKANAKVQSVTEEIRRFAPDGITILVDTVGDMNTVSELLPRMSRNSHWVSAGYLGESGMVDIQKLRMKEITLHTPSGWTKERMDRTFSGIAEGWLQTSSLITHRFPVHQAEEAWRIILDKKTDYLGIVLDWQNTEVF